MTVGQLMEKIEAIKRLEEVISSQKNNKHYKAETDEAYLRILWNEEIECDCNEEEC